MALPALEHFGQHGFDGINRAEQIDANHLLDVSDVDGRQERRHADAGIGDEQVHGAELTPNFTNGSVNLLAVADVGRRNADSLGGTP